GCFENIGEIVFNEILDNSKAGPGRANCRVTFDNLGNVIDVIVRTKNLDPTLVEQIDNVIRDISFCFSPIELDEPLQLTFAIRLR
ncbi:MAG: hypothetical protein AAGK97_13350, partial [Bacteroidota bacterium]